MMRTRLIGLDKLLSGGDVAGLSQKQQQRLSKEMEELLKELNAAGACVPGWVTKPEEKKVVA
jgi:hypothetical protein